MGTVSDLMKMLHKLDGKEEVAIYNQRGERCPVSVEPSKLDGKLMVVARKPLKGGGYK
jgi:hypothetical protein